MNAIGRCKLAAESATTAGDSTMASTMRAVLLDSAPAPPEGLKIVDLPVPKPGHGEVLIIVKAFGLNRSGAQGAPYEADAALTWVSPEYHTRKGLAEGVTFPRVLGIEATGVVAECPGGEFAAGDKVRKAFTGIAICTRTDLMLGRNNDGRNGPQYAKWAHVAGKV